MKSESHVTEKLKNFFDSECTLFGLKEEIDEAVRTMYDAVRKTKGTYKAIEAVCLLSSTARLLDILSEDY